MESSPLAASLSCSVMRKVRAVLHFSILSFEGKAFRTTCQFSPYHFLHPCAWLLLQGFENVFKLIVFIFFYLFDYSLKAHFDVFLCSSPIQESLPLYKTSLPQTRREAPSCSLCTSHLKRQFISLLAQFTLHMQLRMWFPVWGVMVHTVWPSQRVRFT